MAHQHQHRSHQDLAEDTSVCCRLPDELLLLIFAQLNKRDLCRCARVCRRWHALCSTSAELWRHFSVSDIERPRWPPWHLVPLADTRFLTRHRFQHVTRLDLAKLCFDFGTLDVLFRHGGATLRSLCVNFKYLMVDHERFRVDEQCAWHEWPTQRLEKLYLKNVCDRKTRRYSTPGGGYDLLELEIIKLIRNIIRRNASSLRALGLKCVDPNVISACVSDFESVEILLLNNVNDTDSVLQEIAEYCKNLKCLELTKCNQFKGDGLQEIIEQCERLETLQLGKYIFPTRTELNEITNWDLLKDRLRELVIATKFPEQQQAYAEVLANHNSDSSSSSDESNASSTDSSNYAIELYSNTLFQHLEEPECRFHLEFLALEDFTLRFPNRHHHHHHHHHKRLKRLKSNLDAAATPASNLKYLYLRNIRNVKVLADAQLASMSHFVQMQCNLHTLDLIGLYLDAPFICALLPHLNNLRIFHFGHGKSYSSSFSDASLHLSKKSYSPPFDIDSVMFALAEHCTELVSLGLFYRQAELHFKVETTSSLKNEALFALFSSCKHIQLMSYLRSFKIQVEDDDAAHDKDTTSAVLMTPPLPYFHYIRHAICHAAPHVSMRPCYGYDYVAPEGHEITKNYSLPSIRAPPRNDFHVSLLRV